MSAAREWRIRFPVKVYSADGEPRVEPHDRAVVVAVRAETERDALTLFDVKLYSLLESVAVVQRDESPHEDDSADAKKSDGKREEPDVCHPGAACSKDTPKATAAALTVLRLELDGLRQSRDEWRQHAIDRAKERDDALAEVARLNMALTGAQHDRDAAHQAREAETIRSDALRARLEAARKLAGEVLGEGYVIGKPSAIVGVGVGVGNGFGGVFTGRSDASGIGPTGGEP